MLFSYVFNFSSGHKKHEYTTGCSIKEIFKFFEDSGESKFTNYTNYLTLLNLEYIHDKIRAYEHKRRKFNGHSRTDSRDEDDEEEGK